tara:strand:+ start:1007 stop:1588 length:582 start_codon:yes stop_codon:yes gene_type:complete
MRKAFTLTEFLIAILMLGVIAVLVGGAVSGCDQKQNQPASTTGVGRAQAVVSPGADGLTVEQANVKQRIEQENIPASLKHLYIISAYSGEIILYSTVDGKVTSSGKRLTPYSVIGGVDGSVIGNMAGGIKVPQLGRTNEVLQDDGTYGSSIEYLFWWDVNGVYHQHYVSGGQVVHIADQPMEFGRVTLSIENR